MCPGMCIKYQRKSGVIVIEHWLGTGLAACTGFGELPG